MVTQDDESRAWVVLTAGCITMSIALAALGCRVLTRAVLVKQFGIDDWAAVVSGIMMLVCGCVILANTTNGLGRHIWTISASERSLHLKFLYIGIIFYNATLACVKIAFLLQYYRVFAITKIRRIILMCMVIIASWGLAQVLVSAFACTPVHKYWQYSVTAGRCIPTGRQWYTNAGGNIATDIVIFLLPMPVLKSINLQRAQKIMVMGIFSLGFLTVAISVIRIKFLNPIAFDDDFSWVTVSSAAWSIGELSSAVTCLCLPTLRPLFVRLRPSARMFDSTKSSHSGSRLKWSAPRRSFFKHSGTSTTYLRSRSDGTRFSQKEGRNSALLPSINQDDLYSDALDMGGGRGQGCSRSLGRGGGWDRENIFDVEAARRGYFLASLPNSSQDTLRFPDHALCRDTLGMQGTVTTKIDSSRPVPLGENMAEPPTGQIAVRRDVQRECSPRRV